MSSNGKIIVYVWEKLTNMKRFLQIISLCLFVYMPMMAQETSDDRLLPSEHADKYEKGRVTCWGHSVDPSFAEGYEVRCIYLQNSKNFQLELKIENQDKFHILPIDEELAFEVYKLIDAAVRSSNYLPDKEWTVEAIESLKNGKSSFASSIGEDGTFYYFFNHENGAYCWSPEKGNNRALVKIGQVLYDAVANKDLGMIREQLKLINSLTKAYIEEMPEPYREFFILRNQTKNPTGWWIW